MSQKRDKPTLKADTARRIFEGLSSYLTKRKPRSRSSTVRPPCKRPRESACEELRASPTPSLDRTVVRVVRKRLARKGPTLPECDFLLCLLGRDPTQTKDDRRKVAKHAMFEVRVSSE
ncbi:hypothetical protein HPB52_009997 [Rhipicephalus sanguineus]|uniref:Uncharacterized protein n=1 Tax=Rhipicephalus sanguineus TaxID=34632 RepID=A0A9D4SS42_RHISA|nr:hypothetical protein HPB52_009997 [Rhipicephalus sanguineus]